MIFYLSSRGAPKSSPLSSCRHTSHADTLPLMSTHTPSPLLMSTHPLLLMPTPPPLLLMPSSSCLPLLSSYRHTPNPSPPPLSPHTDTPLSSLLLMSTQPHTDTASYRHAPPLMPSSYRHSLMSTRPSYRHALMPTHPLFSVLYLLRVVFHYRIALCPCVRCCLFVLVRVRSCAPSKCVKTTLSLCQLTLPPIRVTCII